MITLFHVMKGEDESSDTAWKQQCPSAPANQFSSQSMPVQPSSCQISSAAIACVAARPTEDLASKHPSVTAHHGAQCLTGTLPNMCNRPTESTSWYNSGIVYPPCTTQTAGSRVHPLASGGSFLKRPTQSDHRRAYSRCASYSPVPHCWFGWLSGLHGARGRIVHLASKPHTPRLSWVHCSIHHTPRLPRVHCTTSSTRDVVLLQWKTTSLLHPCL